MLKKILGSVLSVAFVAGVTLSGVSVVALNNAQACSVDAGIRGGLTHTSNISDSTEYKTSENNGFGGSIFVEYNDDYFGVGGSYNLFSTVKLDTVEGKTESVRIHGPELYGKIQYEIDNVVPYVKTGVMYAMSDNRGSSKSSETWSPVFGGGVNIHIDDGFDIRLGYDHYFDLYDSKVKADIDYVYTGVTVKF